MLSSCTASVSAYRTGFGRNLFGFGTKIANKLRNSNHRQRFLPPSEHYLLWRVISPSLAKKKLSMWSLMLCHRIFTSDLHMISEISQIIFSLPYTFTPAHLYPKNATTAWDILCAFFDSSFSCFCGVSWDHFTFLTACKPPHLLLSLNLHASSFLSFAWVTLCSHGGYNTKPVSKKMVLKLLASFSRGFVLAHSYYRLFSMVLENLERLSSSPEILVHDCSLRDFWLLAYFVRYIYALKWPCTQKVCEKLSGQCVTTGFPLWCHWRNARTPKSPTQFLEPVTSNANSLALVESLFFEMLVREGRLSTLPSRRMLHASRIFNHV